ncbi:hypothetical protein DITRI_Ditri20bG0045500 [Diplodiscus trichospermus]
MSTNKKIMVFCFYVILVGSVLIGEANAAPIIGNPAMAANGQLPCKGGKCRPPPSNPPNRGCEKILRCRNSPMHEEAARP